MEELIEQLKDIILENNYFDTLAGERFREWNGIRNIKAVIAFAGRSKKQQSYRLTSGSDSDAIYVTHLYIDMFGEVKVQLGSEDSDDFTSILHPSDEPVDAYGEEILQEWIDLLTY
jgi:hypothetical protein